MYNRYKLLNYITLILIVICRIGERKCGVNFKPLNIVINIIIHIQNFCKIVINF